MMPELISERVPDGLLVDGTSALQSERTGDCHAHRRMLPISLRQIYHRWWSTNRAPSWCGCDLQIISLPPKAARTRGALGDGHAVVVGDNATLSGLMYDGL